jgi:type I restriction enzyme R subunit
LTRFTARWRYNQALVVSDGLTARIGTLTADHPRFMPWRDPPESANNVIPLTPRRQPQAAEAGGTYPASPPPELEVLIQGVFRPERILDLIRYFTVFESDSETVTKKMAGYHQYYAVNKAIEATLRATSAQGDRRAGSSGIPKGPAKASP